MSRGVRWDSDHVVTLDDPTRAIFEELVRGDCLDRTAIGLDYFDASINRVAAWVIGTRSAQKALLSALLEPAARLRAAEAAGDHTTRLALFEEARTLPLGAVWDEFCRRHNTPTGLGFMAEIKANPGKYSYASSGTGTIGHMQTELFKNLTGTFITHIPYRGAGPALYDTVGGQVPRIFDNMPSAMPFIQSNRLIPIVVAAPQRLAQLPNVPTFKEVGLEPVNRMAFYGIYGPKGMPKEIVDKINAAVRKVLEDPAVKKRIEETGSFVIGNTPEQFGAQMKAEYEVYKKVVDTAKLRLE